MWDPLETLGYTSQSVPYPFPICLNIYSNSESVDNIYGETCNIPKKHLQIPPLDLFYLSMHLSSLFFPFILSKPSLFSSAIPLFFTIF